MLPHRLWAGLPIMLCVVLLLGGCGADDEPAAATEEPDAAADCRAQWRELGDRVDGKESADTPSALATRWTAVVATVDYYATSATQEDCEDTLAAQEKEIAALEGFTVSLQRWDLEHQLARVKGPAQDYAAGPRPSAPKAKKGKKSARPPRPPMVAAALRALAAQAPRATAQQRPGWQQAAATELSDKAAVAKARKDLAFLSRESAAYRQGTAALRTIKQALAATG